MLSSIFTRAILNIVRLENRIFIYIAIAIAALALFTLIGSAIGKPSERANARNQSK